MSIDTRTPAEIAYDATSLYLKLAADEPEDTDTITAILEAIDGGERDPLGHRFDRVVDAVAELPDTQRAHAIALWEGFLVGCAAGA